MAVRYVVVTTGCLVVGAVVGYWGATLRAPSREDLVHAVLQGNPEQARIAAQRLMKEEATVVEPLWTAFTDLGGRPQVSAENKLVVVDVIASSESFARYLPTLALAAFEDPDRAVRLRCIEALQEFQDGPRWDAVAIVVNTLTQETDAPILQRKREFLKDVLFGRNVGPEVTGLSTGAFQKECKERLGQRAYQGRGASM